MKYNLKVLTERKFHCWLYIQPDHTVGTQDQPCFRHSLQLTIQTKAHQTFGGIRYQNGELVLKIPLSISKPGLEQEIANEEQAEHELVSVHGSQG